LQTVYRTEERSSLRLPLERSVFLFGRIFISSFLFQVCSSVPPAYMMRMSLTLPVRVFASSDFRVPFRGLFSLLAPTFGYVFFFLEAVWALLLHFPPGMSTVWAPMFFLPGVFYVLFDLIRRPRFLFFLAELSQNHCPDPFFNCKSLFPSFFYSLEVPRQPFIALLRPTFLG